MQSGATSRTTWWMGLGGGVLAVLLSAPLPAQIPDPQTRPRPIPKNPLPQKETPLDPDKTSTRDAEAPELVQPDREFLEKAAAAGAAEVKLAQLARRKAQTRAVKDLARRIEEDHTKTGEQLRQLAARKKVDLDATPPASLRDMEKALSELEGIAFDHTYANAMLQEHQKDIALFEEAAKSGDAEIKAFAEKTLPALRTHLAHAKAAADQRPSGSR